MKRVIWIAHDKKHHSIKSIWWTGRIEAYKNLKDWKLIQLQHRYYVSRYEIEL